jgi:hypothetical protein
MDHGADQGGSREGIEEILNPEIYDEDEDDGSDYDDE